MWTKQSVGFHLQDPPSSLTVLLLSAALGALGTATWLLSQLGPHLCSFGPTTLKNPGMLLSLRKYIAFRAAEYHGIVSLSINDIF